MNRLTLADVAPAVARVLDTCETDARVAEYVNRAQAVLIPKGNWVGTQARYDICINDGCLTWPRFVETIERFSLCGQPGQVMNQWYEFLENGPWSLDYCSGWTTGNVLVDRNPACTFADITPSPPKKIQLYDFIQGSVAEAPGAYASLYGTDESNNWIWTEVGGQMIEGERVPLVENTFTTSTRYFNSLARVIKPPTVGDVVAYEYDPAAGARTKQLARWEPDETNPVYRRSFVPGVAVTGSDCSLIPLTALVKLRHLPVALPTDFLVLGCLEAIVLMVQGILKRERNLLQESMMYEAAATKALQEELRSHLGSGPALQVRFAPAEIWGGGGIRNAI